MQCYACTDDAVRECPRCGALYCDDHGDAMCARCMDPAEALPSYRVYRGSLLALLAASVFAVWLLVRPIDGNDLDGTNLDGGASVLAPTGTSQPSGDETPPGSDADGDSTDGDGTNSDGTGGDTPGVTTPTPTPTPTPTAVPTETPEPTNGPQTYTVQPGDTMLLIAELFAAPGADLTIYADEIAAANGITDQSLISIGQVLVIP